MKKLLSILTLYLFFYTFLFASQEKMGDTISISIDGYTSGLLQWQKTADLKIWSNIVGAFNTKLTKKIDQSEYLRAQVVTCNESYYSDTFFVNAFPKIKIENESIQLTWKKTIESSSFKMYRITFDKIDTLSFFDQNDTSQLIPINLAYYNVPINIETINNSGEVSERQTISFGDELEIYGVRIDLNRPWLNTCERIKKSINLNSNIENGSNKQPNDFDNVYPYSEMKLCNLISSQDTMEIIFNQDARFSRNENTFVEIPKFYSARFVQDGYEYLMLSRNPYPGFKVDPSFQEDGVEVEKLYVACYHSSINKGILKSVTNSIPLTDLTQSDFRTLTKKSGIGFSLMDYRSVNTLQFLFLVEFANKNSQGVLGDGWVGLEQPSNNYAYRDESSSNSFIIKDNMNYVLSRYWIGMNLSFNIADKNNSIIVRKCTNIITDFPAIGLHTVYFDGQSLNINKNDAYGGYAQYNGIADNVKTSGHSEQNGIDKNRTDQCAVKYRNIENIWGNVWTYIDGVYLDNLVPKIGFDRLKYSDYSSTYKSISSTCPLMDNNGTSYSVNGYLSNMNVDNNNAQFLIPRTIGKNSCDSNNGYGDYFYSYANNKSNLIFGGGWDHYFRAGLFCMRFWGSTTTKWYLYGSRMIYKK